MYWSEDVSERNLEPSTDQDSDTNAFSQDIRNEETQVKTIPLLSRGGAERVSEIPVPWVFIVQALD